MASRQEPIMRFARLQRQREEYKIKLAAQAKEETQISEKFSNAGPSKTTKTKIPEESEQNQTVQKSKQKMTIYEKELEDLTFNQLKTRLAEAKKKNEELNRLIHNKANHEAKAAWDKTSDRREPPWRSSHRKEGGEPILQLHKKISSALERSDQHQSAQTQGPGSGTFDEGFKDATIAHQLLFNKIRERLPWEYVLEFLREEVPEGEIGDESDD